MIDRKEWWAYVKWRLKRAWQQLAARKFLAD